MPSFQHILVPVDLSKRSRRTAAEAIAVARVTGARVTLLHVAHPFLDGETREDLLMELSSLVGRHKEDAPIRVDVTEGDAAQEILVFANANDVDLIVVGGRPRGGIARALVESVSETVTRDAPCSVLMVGERSDVVARVTPRLANVLCAVDLTDTSRNTLAVAATTAAAAGAHLTVLHVINPSQRNDSDETSSRDVEEARNVLDRSTTERLSVLCSPHAATGQDIDVVTLFGDAAALIVQGAAALQVDLLVIGAHSRRVLGHSYLGSTAEHVRRAATCPVLLARPRAATAGTGSHEREAHLVGDS